MSLQQPWTSAKTRQLAAAVEWMALLPRSMPGNLRFYRGYIGIMEKKMEATIVYWGYKGIMEKKMETTVVYRKLYRGQTNV